jgi:hypothetical protein
MHAIAFTGNAYPRRLIALGANKHNIGDMDWTFKLNDPGGNVTAALGLNSALMLLAHIDTLDNNALFVHQDPNHLAPFAAVFFSAGDHFDLIAFANFHLHR